MLVVTKFSVELCAHSFLSKKRSPGKGGGGSSGGLPGAAKGGPPKGGAPKGGTPNVGSEDGAPKGGGLKISCFFFSSPATISLFLCLSGCLLVEFWWCFWRPEP